MKNTKPVAAPLSGGLGRALLIPLALLAAVAGGCTDGGGKKAATQVVAKVNGDEITVHEVNHVLRKQNVTADQADAAKRQVLERLIDQQLAKQQAVEKRLDRTPATMQSIEAARNEILARAYLEQVAASQAVPTEEEISSYYKENPALFAQRQLFGVEEINLPRAQAAPGLNTQVTQARDLREVATWLKSHNVGFAESRGVRAAEQIPLEWLVTMQAMKTGEIRVFESGERLYVIRLAAAQSAPVDEATAKPRIQQFLSNRRLGEAIAEAIKRMRERSNIEYVGEFASTAQAQPKQVAPPSDMEKGIRGLVTK